MLNKYKIRVSILVFLVVFFFVRILLGAAACSDGWRSGSIGSRGACSHHGGVDSVPGIVAVVLASIAVLFFFAYVDKKYRKYKGFIVKCDLPLHHLENFSPTVPNCPILFIPELKAKARKSFECSMCECNFASGTVYCYVSHGSRGEKFCRPCADSIPLKIEMQSHARQVFFSEQEKNKRDIDDYYRRNALAEVPWNPLSQR